MSKLGKLLESWFGWCNHDWSKWKWREATKNYRSGSYDTTIQTRDCKKCGHSQMEEIQ